MPVLEYNVSNLPTTGSKAEIPFKISSFLKPNSCCGYIDKILETLNFPI